MHSMLQEKLAAKEEKQAKEAKYTFALVDGKQEQVPVCACLALLMHA